MKNFILGLSTLVMCGCATTTPAPIFPGKPPIYLDVLFVKQKTNYCGPATLTMVAGFYGHNKDQDSLAKKMITPNKMGTLPIDMISAARREGFVVKKIQTMEEIVNTLYGNSPVIALVNVGYSIMPKWHYLVLIGFNPTRQEFILHSDQDSNIEMSLDDFRSEWQAYENWAIAISPSP